MASKLPPVSPLGEWLDGYCAEQRLTYKTLAAQLGCSPAFLSALRQGRKNLSAELLIKLHALVQEGGVSVPLAVLDGYNQVSGPVFCLPLKEAGLAERKRLIRNIRLTNAAVACDR